MKCSRKVLICFTADLIHGVFLITIGFFPNNKLNFVVVLQAKVTIVLNPLQFSSILFFLIYLGEVQYVVLLDLSLLAFYICGPAL